MKQRPRKPAVPRPAGETLRRAISELILGQPLSVIRPREERDA